MCVCVCVRVCVRVCLCVRAFVDMHMYAASSSMACAGVVGLAGCFGSYLLLACSGWLASLWGGLPG